MADPKVDEAEVAKARKLMEMRGTGPVHRQIAVERKISALPAHVHAAAKADKPAAQHAAKPAAKANDANLPNDYAASHPELSVGPFHFGLLPKEFVATMTNGDQIPAPVGFPCNLNAKALLEKVKKASETGAPLFKELDFLHYQEERNLPRLLQQVTDDHDKIAAKSRGDEKLAKDADDHAEAQEKLRQAGKEVESAYKAVLEAVAGLKVAELKKKLSADEEAEAKAKAELGEIDEKAAEAKEVIKEGLEQLKELAEKGPIEYVTSKAAAVGKYLEDKAIDFLVDDYYAPQRKAAQKVLEAAQKTVADDKSGIEAGVIEQWTNKLESKKSKYEGTLHGLLAAATHARSVETGLIRETEKTGIDSASEAVESRDETVKSSNKAKALVGPQLSACAQIEKDASTLSKEYQAYAESFAKLMKYDIDPPVSKEEKVRAEIHGIAVANIDVAKAVQANAVEETNRCKDAEKFLKTAKYLDQYKEIEEALSLAVNDR